MCGISGIVSLNPVENLGVALRRMQEALRHRGPDDSGIYSAPDERVGLVHTRLAIQDLSSDGHQPMASSDGRFTIVFNGEIYNFNELREELRAGGAVFRSRSDTEVILRLYERHGPECVRRLRGMFAFAIWDAVDRRCFLARDPLGIKPLYVYCGGNEGATWLMFASEIRTLVASGLVPARINPVGLLGYLRYGSVPEPETMLEGMECLPAGSTMIWTDGGRVERQEYWQFPQGGLATTNDSAADRSAAVAQVRTSLLDSICAHFVSDVPVGVFLSGGIDSTAIVALSRVAGKDDLRTFSMGFGGSQFDEASVALRTAQHFATHHQEWQLDGTTAAGMLDSFLAQIDQPTVDGFNTWCVARMAHEQGMKVVLSGLGGDELFAGYPLFRRAPLLARAGHLPAFLRGPLGEAIEKFARVPQQRRLGEFLQSNCTLGDAWEALHALCTWKEASTIAAWLLGQDTHACLDTHGADWAPRASEVPAETISRLETTRYMRNQLLRDGDVTSMAWGLELRVPFVDSKLITSICGLPASERLRAGKQVLIDAVPEVPSWVINRPKMGFIFPFQEWMAGAWRDRVAEGIDGCPVPLKTWYRQWLVVVFQEWWRGVQAIERDAKAAYE